MVPHCILHRKKQKPLGLRTICTLWAVFRTVCCVVVVVSAQKTRRGWDTLGKFEKWPEMRFLRFNQAKWFD